MEKKEWTFIDKTKWPERGPWDTEPDKVQWQDEATGLPCLAVRARSHWCGYVGVTEGHRFFQKGYSTCTATPPCANDIWCEHSPGGATSVHGGLTFADGCQPEPEEGEHREARVCHTPEPGEPDHVWWLGFDCAHAGDKVPAYHQAIYDIEQKYPLAHSRDTYKTLDYVKAECASLAQQLASIS